MRRNSISHLLGWTSLLIGLVAGGCSMFGGGDKSDAPAIVVDPNLFPSDYKAQVLGLMQSRLADPTGVRGAFISDPMLKPVEGTTDARYVVCVRYDAKNGSGRYLGSKDRVAFFLAGKLNQFVDDIANNCVGANYMPFPEAQALRKS